MRGCKSYGSLRESVFYTSCLNISSGDFETMNRLFAKPIKTVSTQIETNTITIGNTGGMNVVSKVKRPNAQLPANAKIMPVAAAKAPRNKYSSAAIENICLRLAPNVRSNTLSWIRWYLLINTEAINTTSPVIMLKPA